jgi:hypothetical protein
MHVAIVLDQLPAADHQIVGRWPSRLTVTGNASLQLDPASGPARAGGRTRRDLR